MYYSGLLGLRDRPSVLSILVRKQSCWVIQLGKTVMWVASGMTASRGAKRQHQIISSFSFCFSAVGLTILYCRYVSLTQWGAWQLETPILHYPAWGYPKKWETNSLRVRNAREWLYWPSCVNYHKCPGARGMNDSPGLAQVPVPVPAPHWIPHGSGDGNSGEGQWLTWILGRKRTDNLVTTETLWQEC